MNIEESTKKEGIHIIIDYLSATFPFKNFDDDLEKKVVEETVLLISQFMGFPLEEVTEDEYATARYRYQYQIGDSIKLRLLGPELKTGMPSCHLELRGQGCREFENQGEKTFYDLLFFLMIRLNANITRIDIAIDDYDGSIVTQNMIKKALDSRKYTTSFKKKSYKLIGSDEEGWSIQFGSHLSTQMLVIYDKKKEQLSKNNECEQDYWLRYEMRFTKEKAYNVCFTLLDHKDDFQNFVYGLLYEMIDFKEDNAYSEVDQYKVETISWWKKFLHEVKKSQIIKYKVHETTLERYLNWVTPILTFYFLFRYIYNAHDMKKFLLNLLNDIQDYFSKMDPKRLLKLNKLLKETGQPHLKKNELSLIFQEVEEFLSREELPF